MNLYPLVRRVLFAFEPERAHGLSMALLEVVYRLKLSRLLFGQRHYAPVRVLGLEFPNIVGLAAGLDKNGDHIDALAACGFGFIEIGTVTPRPQPGNPGPRLFRLADDEAIINRMGFNNDGVEHLVENVKASKRDCIIGINIGKNRDTPLEQAVDDYVSAFEQVYPYADYITVNISSPNTPGLRDLQHGEELDRLLKKLKQRQRDLRQEYDSYKPLLVKIAPDLTDDEIVQLVGTLLDNDIDGVIATNTSNQRPALKNARLAAEQGGLSGRPIQQQSDHVLNVVLKAIDGQIPVIAVGGIMTAADAQRKIRAGASLVQVYTGFIYSGPQLVADICERNVNG
ncbi:MAG: quinone-dependent dihydroorotate dehydrogenase [Thiotrichales bacterium]|nr:MAG: quinone-dependent dihydroorotate dehydrogenase [Thiotrichales bacterium]